MATGTSLEINAGSMPETVFLLTTAGYQYSTKRASFFPHTEQGLTSLYRRVYGA
jgi:hypothetical protein